MDCYGEIKMISLKFWSVGYLDDFGCRLCFNFEER